MIACSRPGSMLKVELSIMSKTGQPRGMGWGEIQWCVHFSPERWLVAGSMLPQPCGSRLPPLCTEAWWVGSSCLSNPSSSMTLRSIRIVLICVHYVFGGVTAKSCWPRTFLSPCDRWFLISLSWPIQCWFHSSDSRRQFYSPSSQFLGKMLSHSPISGPHSEGEKNV